jgi:hypothetical protein
MQGFRFFFFSREEQRVHVHVSGERGEAKFWLEPQLELAQQHGLSEREVNLVRQIIMEREDEIRSAWQRHFDS